MCGRTACTLGSDRLSLATSYKPAKGQHKGNRTFKKTRWVDQPGGKTYHPSHNIGPTGALPVLIRGDHVSCPQHDQMLMPMRWGLVPFFHKGDISDMKLTTFNARSEDFLQKTMFSHPFKKGQRCVIVCDGYYEWKKNGNTKKPYFLHTDPDAKWDERDYASNVSDDKLWNEDGGWKGRGLTMMAGIFDTWKGAGDEPLYSCTILTQASNSKLQWIHHRMPVFLRSTEVIEGWLASDTTDEAAVALITPEDSLAWHPVSPDINNVRNKEATFARVTETKEANFMSSWLKKADKRPAESDVDGTKPSKR